MDARTSTMNERRRPYPYQLTPLFLISWSPSQIEDDSCGEDGGENNWYYGHTECYRANAAYSLYGVPSGSSEDGCTRETFLYSFFSAGIESFTAAMAGAGLTFYSAADDGYPDYSSVCSSENANGNGDDNVQHGEKTQSWATSYSLGCYNHAFVEQTFSGTDCNKNSLVATTNRLTTFNQDLRRAECLQVYSSSSGNSNEDVTNFLQYSMPCSVRAFPNGCPDPYGKLHAEARALERQVDQQSENYMAKSITAYVLLGLGILLLVLALLVHMRRSRLRKVRQSPLSGKRKNKNTGWFASSSKKKRSWRFWRREGS